MRLKYAKEFFVIAIPTLVITIFEIKGCNQSSVFYKTQLNTTITKVENNFTGGRSYDYITKEQITISLMNYPSTNLRIGDSVAKEKDSWMFDVFRYDSIADSFYYFKKYDQRHLNR